MTTAIRQPVTQALTIGEKRTLTIDAARVDEKHLVDGPGDTKRLPKIEAELVSTRRSRKERHYRIEAINMNIKPAADCADDIALITGIVQSCMEPPPAAPKAQAEAIEAE